LPVLTVYNWPNCQPRNIYDPPVIQRHAVGWLSTSRSHMWSFSLLTKQQLFKTCTAECRNVQQISQLIKFT